MVCESIKTLLNSYIDTRTHTETHRKTHTHKLTRAKLGKVLKTEQVQHTRTFTQPLMFGAS